MASINHPWEQIHRNKEWSSKDPFPRFFEVVNDFKKSRERILDLGCGKGRHLIQFLKERFEVMGMDISLSALLLVKEWAEEERLISKTINADMRTAFPLGDGVFDAIFSTQVIHHARIAEIRTTIGEILRVLRSGGLAFITVSGGVDKGIRHQSVEAGTYIPLSGSEKGLPHHIFNEEELRLEF